MSQYHVVSFDDEDSVSVTPCHWVNNGKCFWPPYKSLSRIHKAVQQREVPAAEWTTFSCRILYTGRYILQKKI